METDVPSHRTHYQFSRILRLGTSFRPELAGELVRVDVRECSYLDVPHLHAGAFDTPPGVGESGAVEKPKLT